MFKQNSEPKAILFCGLTPGKTESPLRLITYATMGKAGLSARERNVLELRFLQGLDRTETRKRLTLSKERVQQLEKRGLRKLRKA